MKRIFKYFALTGLSGLLCLSLALPANAQRGGGGVSRGGGGGGFSGGQRGGGGFSGGQRGGGGFSSGQRGGGGFSSGQRGGGFSNGGGFRGNTGGNFSGGRSMSSPRQSGIAPQRMQGQRGNIQGNRSLNSIGGGYSTSPSARGYMSGRSGVIGRGSIGGRAYGGGRAYAGGRSYAGGRGYIGGAFGRRGGYYYNRGFYRSSYYPRLGFQLGYLPYGYYPFWWGDAQFYYSDGYFYNYNNNQYTVVEPPIGAAINTLPSGAQPITINGQQYYELNGVYYLPITKDDGSIAYQVAGKDGQLDTTDGTQVDEDNTTMDVPPGTHPVARIGDLIQQLPQDSRKVRVNGESLYITPDDVYLKQTTDSNGNKVYTVVGTPDQPEN